ncbi:MAG TPA: DUF1223 domain-containing protein [Candidatus Saccharimonadales bacterium]|nr:DUF1223 domain-containing protein [Candidatus Saccharimonadales bacterium]
MKRALALVPIVFLATTLTLQSQTASVPQPPGAASGLRTAVVVELFTSEGCSSCPPADALLAKLDSEQPIPNTEVIALEEHVDYWNEGGWFDPYSSPEWTQRQQEYSFDLKSGQTFTPQMIVNGTAQFVGNRAGEALQSIQKAATPAPVPVAIKVGGIDGKTVRGVTIGVGRLAGSAQNLPADVWLAVTEKGLHTSVKAGENSGSDLHHAPVVRSLRRIGTADRSKDSAFSGTPSVSLNSKWKLENLRLVVFVQERKTRHILGAAAASLVAPAPQS